MRLLKTILTVAGLLTGMLGLPACSVDSPAASARQKVVYHINYDDPDQQVAALRNIQNHVNAVGVDKLDLKVVLHGKGVSLVARAKDDMNLQSRIAGLKTQQVAFQICNNTLVGKKINPDTDLFDVSRADIVPSGVAELARLQNEGYAYLKP